VQLYNQFAASGQSDAEREDAKDMCTACLRGQLSVVQKLLEKAGDTGKKKLLVNKEGQETTLEGLKKGQPPMFYAVNNNHPDVMAVLLKHGAVLSPALQNMALEFGFIEITSQMELNAGQANERLPDAVENNKVDNVKTFLSQGANPDLEKDGQPMLCLAVQRGHVEIVRALLDRNQAKSSTSTKTRGSSSGSMTKPQKKLSVEIKSATHNLQNNNRESPLDLAIRHEKGSQMIPLLSEAGADLNAATNVCIDGQAREPLYIATKDGNVELIEALIRCGANPNLVGDETNQKINLLSLAVQHENFAELIPVLVNAKVLPKVNINERCSSSRDTLLCTAVKDEKMDLVKALVTSGANVNLMGVSQTPLEIAQDIKKKEDRDTFVEYVQWFLHASATCVFCWKMRMNAFILGHAFAAVVKQPACMRLDAVLSWLSGVRSPSDVLAPAVTSPF
jgi:ankyrin repeat protein